MDGNRKSPNFPQYWSGTLVADSIALLKLGDILSTSGELLPLRANNGTTYTLVNLSPLFDCVDKLQSDWTRFPHSERAMFVKRYQFERLRLTDRSIFKTDMLPSQIFATEVHLTTEREFKPEVERLVLTRLSFREVWNDDGDEILPIDVFEDVKKH